MMDKDQLNDLLDGMQVADVVLDHITGKPTWTGRVRGADITLTYIGSGWIQASHGRPGGPRSLLGMFTPKSGGVSVEEIVSALNHDDAELARTFMALAWFEIE